MTNNQEKFALTAELEGLKTQLRPQEEIDGLEAKSKAEYDALMDEIDEKYNKSLSEATLAKDKAIEAAQLAIDQATTIYEDRVTELGINKGKLEAEAEAYYQQLRDRDADIIAIQNDVQSRIDEKTARLAAIAEEEARQKAEEEARIKAQAEEARRQAEAASRAAAAHRPKIKF